MRVLTYNLMFLDEYDRALRARKILAHLLELSPDIMLFQEMGPGEYQLFKSTLGQYQVSKPLPGRYWSCIFVKNGIQGTFDYIPFEQTSMRRGMVTFKTPDTIYISTHLESLQKEESIEARKSQLKQLAKTIQGYTKVIVGMDSNTKVPIRPRDDLNDVWEDDPRPTWHGNRYYNIPHQLRYDRFLVAGVQVTDRMIDEFEKQSDHDALVIDYV